MLHLDDEKMAKIKDWVKDKFTSVSIMYILCHKYSWYCATFVSCDYSYVTLLSTGFWQLLEF